MCLYCLWYEWRYEWRYVWRISSLSELVSCMSKPSLASQTHFCKKGRVRWTVYTSSHHIYIVWSNHITAFCHMTHYITVGVAMTHSLEKDDLAHRTEVIHILLLPGKYTGTDSTRSLTQQIDSYWLNTFSQYPANRQLLNTVDIAYSKDKCVLITQAMPYPFHPLELTVQREKAERPSPSL